MKKKNGLRRIQITQLQQTMIHKPEQTRRWAIDNGQCMGFLPLASQPRVKGAESRGPRVTPESERRLESEWESEPEIGWEIGWENEPETESETESEK